MGQRGTFGYIKDKKYYSWIMQCGGYWESDNIVEIIKMDFSKFYQWIKLHGEDRFIELINQEPNGWQYPEFRLKAGTLSGDREAWEGDQDDELNNELSPYGNIWLDVDTKTINIQTKDGIGMFMSYTNPDPTVGQKLILEDIFHNYEDIEMTFKQIKAANYEKIDYYVFFCIYDQIRDILG